VRLLVEQVVDLGIVEGNSREAFAVAILGEPSQAVGPVVRPVVGWPAVGRLVVWLPVVGWLVVALSVMALVGDKLEGGAQHSKALVVRLVHLLLEQVDEVEELEDQSLAPECCY
jgi:hypothetical protein